MSASEVRALFAVASRPEVVSLAGGMPYVQALPTEDVLEVVRQVLDEHGTMALQYGGGQGHVALRERLVALMAEEGDRGRPRGHGRSRRARSRRSTSSARSSSIPAT